MTVNSFLTPQSDINGQNASPNIFDKYIVSLCILKTVNKVFLLKVNTINELFIEMLDLNNNIAIVTPLKEKINFLVRNLTVSQVVSENDKVEDITWGNEVLAFFVPEEMTYIFIMLRLCQPIHSDNNTLNIQIDLKGSTLKKEFVTTPEELFPNYDQLNGLIVIPDYKFLNTKTFKQVDLFEFFGKYLEDENFTYLHYEEGCSTFATPDKNLYGLVLFDRDGDDPRGVFCVFKIDEDISPKLIFKHKVDEFGMNHTFSENGKKIAYIYRRDWGEIELVIRSLDANEFENETRLTVYFSKESVTAENILLTDDNHIIIAFPERFEVYNYYSGKRMWFLKRDRGNNYELANNTLFYLHNRQLKIHKI